MNWFRFPQGFDNDLIGFCLSDGSFLLCCLSLNRNDQEKLSSSRLLLLNGIKLVLDFSKICLQFTAKLRRIPFITSFKAIQLFEKVDCYRDCNLLVMGTKGFLDVWILFSSSDDRDALSCEFISSVEINLDPSESISCVQIIYRSMEGDGDLTTVDLLVGTSLGNVHMLRMTIPTADYNGPYISKSIHDNTDMTLLQQQSIGWTEVVAIEFHGDVVIAACGGSLVAFEVDANGNMIVHDQVVISSHAITSCTIVNAGTWCLGSGGGILPILTTSCDAKLSVSYLVHSLDGRNQSSYRFDLAHRFLVSSTKGVAHMGLAMDPTSNLIAYVYKAEAARDNCREVQLNNNLSKARSLVSWVPMPLLPRLWAVCSAHVYEMLLSLSLNSGIGSFSIASLAIPYINSLEQCLDDNKMNFILPKSKFKPLERSSTSTGASATAGSSLSAKKRGRVSGSVESEDELNDDSEDEPLSPIASNKKQQQSATLERKKRASIRKIYEKVKDQLGPDLIGLIAMEVPRLINCAALLCLKINERERMNSLSTEEAQYGDGDAFSFDEMGEALIQSMSDAEKVEIILRLPTGDSLLK